MNVIGLLLALIILGLVFWLVIWLVDWIGIPEPVNKIIKAVVGIVLVLYLLSILFGMAALPSLRVG
jgi:heme A synthase